MIPIDFCSVSALCTPQTTNAQGKVLLSAFIGVWLANFCPPPPHTHFMTLLLKFGIPEPHSFGEKLKFYTVPRTCIRRRGLFSLFGSFIRFSTVNGFFKIGLLLIFRNDFFRIYESKILVNASIFLFPGERGINLLLNKAFREDVD